MHSASSDVGPRRCSASISVGPTGRLGARSSVFVSAVSRPQAKPNHVLHATVSHPLISIPSRGIQERRRSGSRPRIRTSTLWVLVAGFLVRARFSRRLPTGWRLPSSSISFIFVEFGWRIEVLLPPKLSYSSACDVWVFDWFSSVLRMMMKQYVQG